VPLGVVQVSPQFKIFEIHAVPLTGVSVAFARAYLGCAGVGSVDRGPEFSQLARTNTSKPTNRIQALVFMMTSTENRVHD
jgi:hypothetical protein